MGTHGLDEGQLSCEVIIMHTLAVQSNLERRDQLCVCVWGGGDDSRALRDISATMPCYPVLCFSVVCAPRYPVTCCAVLCLIRWCWC